MLKLEVCRSFDTWFSNTGTLLAFQGREIIFQQLQIYYFIVFGEWKYIIRYFYYY